MTNTTRAAYERTHNIACSVCATLGIKRGSGQDAVENDINMAVSRTMDESGSSVLTAKKHVLRYVHNLPSPAWGRRKKQTRGE